VAQVQGHPTEARGYLDQLLRSSPTSTAALLLRGDVAAKQGDREQARRDYAQATRILQAGGDSDSVSLRRSSSATAARLETVQARLRRLDRRR
jgi:predicted negative regulator of RcsB-dependent stress response